MFAPRFDYRRAETLDEALALLADGATPLAGGHGLLPDVKAGEAAPERLVDVGDVDALAGIEPTADGVRIGALASHADVAASGPVAAVAPALARTAERVGDPQIRNRGTIGGNLAEADPAADLPAAVLASGATLELVGPDGDRTVPAEAFLQGPGETALGEADLLAAVAVPAHDAGSYVKKAHPATGYAMVGVATVLDVSDGRVTGARVAVTGATDRAVRLDAVEASLDDEPLDAVDPARVAAAAEGTLAPEHRRGDAHASAAYRAGVLPAYVERAVADALEAAAPGGGGA